MNIFYLDTNIVRCAEYHADKHVCKMIVEYAQLLSTAHYVLDGIQVGYKPTHKNHPCAVWARQSNNNYTWLVALLGALLLEYAERYGKVHKTNELVLVLDQPPRNIPTGPLTPPPQCVPDDCKGPDTVLAYRKYYNTHKASMAKWKLGNVPHWFKPVAGDGPIIAGAGANP